MRFRKLEEHEEERMNIKEAHTQKDNQIQTQKWFWGSAEGGGTKAVAEIGMRYRSQHKTKRERERERKKIERERASKKKQKLNKRVVTRCSRIRQKAAHPQSHLVRHHFFHFSTNP